MPLYDHCKLTRPSVRRSAVSVQVYLITATGLEACPGDNENTTWDKNKIVCHEICSKYVYVNLHRHMQIRDRSKI